ncbi:MAG: copper-binding protein [Proteobacteria bacterium]|nr:copper-binding protein [Pseudomonadota bacterium]
MSQGVVKRLDVQTGVVTIAHGSIDSLGRSPMTMGFLVKDPVLLGKLAIGPHVSFEFVREGDDYLLKAVK